MAIDRASEVELTGAPARYTISRPIAGRRISDMRMLLLAAANLSLIVSAPAIAAPCKDPKTGKFMKCAAKAPAKVVRCKNAKGQFAKCGTAGAKPM